MKEREIKYDFLRAVAVIAIMMVHAIPAVSVNDKQWWFAAVMQPLLLSFVGIYFMLSGMFLLDSATGDIMQFYKKRVMMSAAAWKSCPGGSIRWSFSATF